MNVRRGLDPIISDTCLAGGIRFPGVHFRDDVGSPFATLVAAPWGILDATAFLSGKAKSLNGRSGVCVKDAGGARYILDAGTAASPQSSALAGKRRALLPVFEP